VTGACEGSRFFVGERLHWRRMEDVERRIEEERARVEAEYRRVLETSVEFERRIRDRWRDKVRDKNRRIAELEQRVADLKRRIGEKEDPASRKNP
jgi:uncharacterized protein YceH (UPF0502 family)